MGFPFGGFDFMFDIIPAIVAIGFIVVIVFIIWTAARGVAQWGKNNNSPVLTVSAKIVAKRVAVSRHTHHNANDMAMSHTSSSSTYYASFEVESGDRMEFRVPDNEYGMLAEGDMGRLTFQGTRYKGFERQR